MKKKYKFIRFILLFIFVIVFNLLFIPNNLDEIWNYGFSYAIRLGEIPYKDFNMVLTPLYSFIMTIPLFIYNNYLSFIIFHSLIVTIEFYLLYKMYDKMVYFILLISLMFFPLIYPTYNSFFLFLMVLITYLENKNFKYKDFILGVLIACCVLTKQSVGIFFIVPCLLFMKNNNISIKNRIIGFTIPIFLFLLYLFITKSFYNFLDLCLFGLFDFSGNNHGFNLSVVVFILILFISIIIVMRNKNSISNYYFLISYLLFVPLFDNLHLFYVIFSFVLLIINNIRTLKINYLLLFCPCLFFIVFIFGSNMNVLDYSKNSLSHFEYKSISNDRVEYTKKILDYIKNNDSIIYNDDSYFYRICANQKIGYLDLLNHGNHGFDSSKKLIKLIKNNSDKKFLINMNLKKRIENNETQMDYDGYRYIIDNGKMIGKVEDYYIYTFK